LRAHGVALTIGDHPERPFQSHEATADWRFVRFRPPIIERGQPAPQIRLDRALQFLIGDRLA